MPKKYKQKNISNKTKKRPLETYIGKLDINSQGMGFVSVLNFDMDVKVKRENQKSAMQNDTVEIAIIPGSSMRKRPEGIITKIIERGTKELIGTLQRNVGFSFVLPDNKYFTKDIFINEENSKAYQNGDKVLVKIINWNDRQKNPEGKILELVTNDKLNDIAMKEILLENGFSLTFPDEVLKETAQLSEVISEDVNSRIDLRNVFTITIDPHDAKDFDDAISFEKISEDTFQIGVHIADVSHFVTPGTALDSEAYQRATSVYLPDRVLPMLPEKISNELCSLRPNEDKFTFSVLFTMDKNAQVKEYQISKTIIHSDKRFTYEQVQDIIETGSGEYEDIILQLNSISQKLRAEKFKKGAINFSSEETKFILDENGIPEAVVIKESKEAHQLIEELMLLANKTVAEFVSKKEFQHQKIPFPYRIHDIPDMDKLIEFVDFAKKFGYQFNLSTPESIAKSFNKMLSETDSDPEHQILHVLGIRTMAKAVYSTKNIGHYGLAFPYYCHFTSPIRRYPDIIVHRILMQCLENKIVPIKDLEVQCNHCSERERKAMEAEREGAKYKQVELMQKHIGEVYDAVISGVAKHGFWAQTIEYRCEGFVPLSSISLDEEFQFVSEEFLLIGKKSKKKFQIGGAIRVKILSADLSKKQIDFAFVD